MKNLFIIPTDKPSRLILQTNNELRLSVFSFKGAIASGITQNIYITSDKEIKKGDWVLFMFDEVTEIVKVTTIVNNAFDSKEGFGYGLEYSKKIILTTDQDLIKNGVQSIDDEFLEWFVKNPSCDEVEVKSELLYEHKDTYRPYPSDCKNLTKTKINYYLSIIPKQLTKDRILSETPDEVKQRIIDRANLLVNKQETKCYCGHTTTCDCGTEEPKQETLEEYTEDYKPSFVDLADTLPKQETLEEVSERYANMQEDVSETIGKYLVKAVFKDGAYWNQERGYSEEEVILLLQKAVTHQDDGETGSLVTAQGKIRTANFYSWFERFKKQ